MGLASGNGWLAAWQRRRKRSAAGGGLQRFAVQLAQCRPELQQAGFAAMGGAGHQADARVVQKGFDKTLDAKQTFAPARLVIGMRHEARLPVTGTRFAAPQFGKTPVEQQQIRRQRVVSELGVVDATRPAGLHVQHGARFLHLIADAQRETALQMRDEQQIRLRDRKLIYWHDDLL